MDWQQHTLVKELDEDHLLVRPRGWLQLAGVQQPLAGRRKPTIPEIHLHDATDHLGGEPVDLLPFIYGHGGRRLDDGRGPHGLRLLEFPGGRHGCGCGGRRCKDLWNCTAFSWPLCLFGMIVRPPYVADLDQSLTQSFSRNQVLNSDNSKRKRKHVVVFFPCRSCQTL